jgi:arylsulfatase A-like enzyme
MLSEALSAAGYRCDAVGKWHLGYGDLQHPNKRGFNSFYGFLEAFSYFIDPDLPGVESWQFDEFSEKYIWNQERKAYSAIQRDGVEIEESTHLTDAFAREAVSRIRQASRNEEPFFLYVPFSAPHTPFQALTEYTQKFSHIEDPRKRIYYAMIAQLDDAVGEILAAVDESGTAENTLVIFTSDNGGATYTGATGNDPLRGGKMSHFEGGLAVPMMMRWPARIDPGSRQDEAVMHIDIFATALAAADVPAPDDRPLDGRNLLVEENGDPETPRALFWRSDYNRIVRYGDWKLITNGKDGQRWLYNLSDDREENHNLVELRPDILHILETMIQEWDAEMMPPGWPRVMDYYYDEDGEGYWFAT